MQTKEQLIEQKQSVESQLSQMKADNKSLLSDIKAKEKQMQTQIRQTIEQQKNKIKAPYEEQLAKEQKAQDSVREKRQKTKEKGIEQRVQFETAQLQKENEQIKGEVKQAFRKAGAPFFCNTNWFYTLYYPQGFRDMIWFFIYILVGYFGIPWLVTFQIVNPSNAYVKVLLHLFCMAIVFGIYIVFRLCVRDMYLDVIKEQYDNRKRIKENKKEIRKITHAIKKDKDESGYGLSEFDKKIKKHQEEIEKIKKQQEKALKEFEEKEKNIMIKQIEEKYQKDITSLKEQQAAMEQQIQKKQNLIDEISAQIQKLDQSDTLTK